MSAAPTFHESATTAEAARAGMLYERYAGPIMRFCRSRLPSSEEAEDAVQHTFLNAYRSLRTGTVPRAEAAWLYKIAENVCHERRLSAWRRSRVEVVSDDGLVGDRPAPEHSREELVGVADALAELTPNQRRAILLREWQGLSYREIAQQLGLTQAAVETLLFRARRSLAQKLDRSRGRAWSWLNLGSGLASAKSLLGGVAATAVVAAGVTAAVPALRHDPNSGGAARATVVTSTPVSFAAALSAHGSPAATNLSRVATPARAVRTTQLLLATPSAPRPTTAPRGQVPVEAEPVREPAPVAVPRVVDTPATPPAPALPPVPAVPPVTPVQLPALPQVPPVPLVGLPTLPSVPPEPELPKLP